MIDVCHKNANNQAVEKTMDRLPQICVVLFWEGHSDNMFESVIENNRLRISLFCLVNNDVVCDKKGDKLDKHEDFLGKNFLYGQFLFCTVLYVFC